MRSIQINICNISVYCLLIQYTGCSLNIVFFSKILKYIPDSVLSRFPLGVSVCTHIRQVEHQRCTRTGRVQKNHKIKEKTQYLMNTLYLPSCVSVVCVLPLAVSSNFEHFPAKKGLSGPPG